MKTYKKVHTLDKAAKSHKAKIKKRGGKIKETKTKSKIVLEYTFPEKK